MRAFFSSIQDELYTKKRKEKQNKGNRKTNILNKTWFLFCIFHPPTRPCDPNPSSYQPCILYIYISIQPPQPSQLYSTVLVSRSLNFFSFFSFAAAPMFPVLFLFLQLIILFSLSFFLSFILVYVEWMGRTFFGRLSGWMVGVSFK